MGAVIVLLPADPEALVHPDGDLPEDLHVTLLYLRDTPKDDSGEPTDEPAVTPEEADQLAQVLAACAAMPPIEAKISGAGILGADAAVVVLLESQELCDLRCQLQDGLGHLIGDVEKFPNFIPHLTIGYPEDVDHGEALLHHALPMVGNPIVFDRLALFNGDAHTEFPLGQASPVEPQLDPVIEPDDAVEADTASYSFGQRIAMAEPTNVAPAAPAAAPPAAGAAPPKPQRTVILIGMPVSDASKVPYKPSGLPFQSPNPYVALLEVKLRQDEVPEQLAQVLATVHVDPVTSTGKESLTASDTAPPRRAVLIEQEPLAAASEAIKAALAVYSVNVDDYPFVVQLGQAFTKADVTAVIGQSLDFAGLIAVLQDGTVVHEDKGDGAPTPPAAEPGSPVPPQPATTVAPT